jgi:FAD dependent oxidoreductase
VSDVLVIGAGPAGVLAAIRAGDLGARTELVTSTVFGGMATNEGPVPVRTLAHAARVLEDDGVDRGLLFTCIVGDLARQFEFVQTQWINDGAFMGSPDEMDPLVGPNDGTRRLTIPQEPIRRRLPALPRFVINRGGEYCFMPGLRALRWIAELKT